MNSTITVNMQKNELVIEWNHRVRMAGGRPLFEANPIQFGIMQRENDC